MATIVGPVPKYSTAIFNRKTGEDWDLLSPEERAEAFGDSPPQSQSICFSQ